ncbi:mitochondrial carrier domain-containing protein [Pavlovales sp. CCMP2436]|nr:mitochondrial carrier domain-containing protein [Pavlovales sp. CCMP2436]|mmetsp:Transcript_24765/g.62678  ORF Transcript_24765/g.62678 Transcript_24765/m.62678 type:complete len:317 (-) Transcript_24765:58-1008(-)
MPSVGGKQPKPAVPVAAGILMAGTVSAAITLATNPLDCLRVRWQVTQQADAGPGLWSYARRVIAQEGFLSGLYRPGLGANMASVFVCTGIRVGIYKSVCDALLFASGSSERDGGTMATAGLLSGALSFFVASPFFQAKTRLQAESGRIDPISGLLATGPRAGERPSYTGMPDFFRKLVANEGSIGLLRGADALVVRGSLLSMGHLLGYDGGKQWAKSRGLMQEGPLLHASASVFAAFFSTTLASPGDRVMTEYQTAPNRGVRYSSALDCARSIMRREGMPGFFRGWLPMFLRMGPTFAAFGTGYEALRLLAGYDYF